MRSERGSERVCAMKNRMMRCPRFMRGGVLRNSFPSQAQTSGMRAPYRPFHGSNVADTIPARSHDAGRWFGPGAVVGDQPV
jgi:hypothetical protein